MHRASIDWQKVVTTVALAAVAVGFGPLASAQKESELRAPAAFNIADDSREAIDRESLNFETPDKVTTHPAQGTVEVVRERYPDGKVKIERQVTIDEKGNYVNHGTWKMWAANGTAIAEGQYDMGQRVGAWTRWIDRREASTLNQAPFRQFKAPFVSQVTFVDGKMDGQWLIVDADQRQVVQVSLSMGERHGPVTHWLPNGKVSYQAAYDHGVPVGDVMELNRRGEMGVTATYVDGRRIVTKASNYGNRARQKKSEEMYLAATTQEQSPDDFWNLSFATYKTDGVDLLHGTAKTWYEDGKPRSEGFYEYGKKSGTFTYWYPNGQAQAAGEYQDDQPVGTWVWWHENGIKSAIGEYREGYLHGPWRWWNETGLLVKQRVYDGTERITSEDADDAIDIGQRTTEGETEVR